MYFLWGSRLKYFFKVKKFSKEISLSKTKRNIFIASCTLYKYIFQYYLIIFYDYFKKSIIFNLTNYDHYISPPEKKKITCFFYLLLFLNNYFFI